MATISRRGALAALLGAATLGAAGCGPHENEKDFAKTPGSAPPDAPKTAEEYELKRKKVDATP